MPAAAVYVKVKRYIKFIGGVSRGAGGLISLKLKARLNHKFALKLSSLVQKGGRVNSMCSGENA